MVCWLASALGSGLFGIVLVAFETQFPPGFGECGLDSSSCSSFHPITGPSGPAMVQPFAWVGALLIAYAVICLISCVIVWFRSI
jgi:hypothetical protein